MSNSLDPDQVLHFVRAGLSVPILLAKDINIRQKLPLARKEFSFLATSGDFCHLLITLEKKSADDNKNMKKYSADRLLKDQEQNTLRKPSNVRT